MRAAASNSWRHLDAGEQHVTGNKGGGIGSGGPLTLTSSTVSGNRGDGIGSHGHPNRDQQHRLGQYRSGR